MNKQVLDRRTTVICPKCSSAQLVDDSTTRFRCAKCSALVLAGFQGVTVTGFRMGWNDAARLMIQIGILSVPVSIFLFVFWVFVFVVLGSVLGLPELLRMPQ